MLSFHRICANRRNCINGSLLEINKALSTVRLKDEKDSTPGLHALTSYKRRRHVYKSSQYGDKCSCIHRGMYEVIMSDLPMASQTLGQL